MNDSAARVDPGPRRDDAWSAYGRATAALRGALLTAGLVTASNRPSPRAVMLVWLLLLAILVFLHIRAQNDDVMRHSEVLAQLATLKLIDARWDVAVLQARGPHAARAGTVQNRDASAIQRALDAAARLARSNALRAAATDLKSAYAEKADLVTRYRQASSDSRQALEAAMRADVAVSGLVRSAWRDFPQRERLVAAENLVARVLAEAQQYHHAPTATHRDLLEAAAGDLPRARALPAPVLAGLARLESDVHQLLLLKPLEQMLGERLTVLNTGARADALAETFRRSLADALDERSRYGIALLVYAALLALLAAYAGLRLYRRYRALENERDALSADLADARARLGTHEEDAVIVAESSSAVRAQQTEAEVVRIARR